MMQRRTTSFPRSGAGWEDLQTRMMEMRRHDVDWREGRSALHVYHAGEDVRTVANDAYMMFMSESALAPAAFPSLATMEKEVLDAVLDLLHAAPDGAGSFTSGGTESIFLAMKAARDWARENRSGTSEPLEVVMPRTAHPAFDKAAHFLGMRAIRVPVRSDFRADPEALEAAIGERTAMLVASAPALPYGVVDGIETIGAMALRRDLWLHVDACIGGFLAPFAKKLGYPIPDFDFSVPGVRSMSADIHKFGYAAKGASVVLYAQERYHRSQFTEFSDWPKGKYRTPTMAGTRSGGGVASAWAVMHYLGEEGYLSLAARTMKLWQKYLDGIAAIPGCLPVGKPDLAITAFTARSVDIFAVAEEMTRMGWYVSRIAEPSGIHQIVNLAHEPIVEKYLDDLKRAMGTVRHSLAVARNAQVDTY